MSEILRFPSMRGGKQNTPIRLAAPTPCMIVEWPTGIFYGNHAICECCQPCEAEGFVVFLNNGQRFSDWASLCRATEWEAVVMVEKAQRWGIHEIENLRFHQHSGNRYCWHRCSFDLLLNPSMAFPVSPIGHFAGWLAWPWDIGSGYDPRPWG